MVLPRYLYSNYRHIKSKPITVEENETGDKVIDVSELIRVYGDQLNVKNNSDVITSDNKNDDLSQGDKEELAALRVKVDLIEQQAEKNNERYEREIERLEKALDKAQDNATKVTHLLEDKSGDRAGEWEKSMRALEARIANQEKKDKEQKEREDKMQRQNRALKKALDAEKNKSFFQKLFG